MDEKIEVPEIRRYSVRLREVLESKSNEYVYYVGVERGYASALNVAKCTFGGDWDKVDEITIARLG